MIPVISSYMLITFHLAYFNAPKERQALAGDPRVSCREEGNVPPPAGGGGTQEIETTSGKQVLGAEGRCCPWEQPRLR